MQNFNGIDLSVLGLLEINRFNNSKAFYDEHKEEIKQKGRVPLSKLALDISPYMYDIDDEIFISPGNMVSRIRRDTRFTKDKSLYRQNIWMIFRHKKNEQHRSPVFWVEYCPSFYSYGVGYFGCTPDFMEFYRKMLREDWREWADIISDLREKGYITDGERYKREKPGCPDPAVSDLYNLKELFFVKVNSDLSRLAEPSFLDEYKSAVADMTAAYKYILKLHKLYLIQKGEDDA